MADPTNVESTATRIGHRLSRAPLARVLCQVRWPLLSKFDLDLTADELSRAIGDAFPLRDAQQELQFTLGPSGVSQQSIGTIHRFQSADRGWTVSLGSQFLSLETTRYDGHADFIQRLGVAMTALTHAASIPFLIRVGYRYTNRLTGSADLDRLGAFFVEGVLGGLAQGDTSQLLRTVTESVYSSEGSDYLLVRSALLEPQMALEPTLPPAEEKSWILDLDSFREDPDGLPVEALPEVATQLSATATGHFWSVIKDDFIERFK